MTWFIYKLPGHWMSYEAPHSICTCMLHTRLFSIPWKRFFWCLWHDAIWLDNLNADHLDVATRMSPVTSRRLNKFPLQYFQWTHREWSKMIFLQNNMATNRNHTTLLKKQSSIKYLPQMRFLSNFGCEIIVMCSVNCWHQ